MSNQINILGIDCHIIRKDIKNVHLNVHPPFGLVSISVPTHMEIKLIEIFIMSKMSWIKKQQKEFIEQERESSREFIERESHYLWGQRYLLEIVEKDTQPLITLNHNTIQLIIRPNTSLEQRQEIFAHWYREKLREKALPLIEKWEKTLGVKVNQLFIQKMKTQWGSCTHDKGYIRLNTELAKKNQQCLEFIVVHEMIHLIEPTHNKRFKALMDSYLPNWQLCQQELNSTMLSAETWKY